MFITPCTATTRVTVIICSGKAMEFFMKKDKKITPEETMPKKDYQQEVDPDVKGKEKSKKAVIGIVAFIVVFFVALLGWYINDNSVKEENYDVDGQTAAPAVAQGKESDGDVIEVNGSLLDLTKETVQVTVPLAFYQGEEVADTLDKSQQASGYLSVEKSDVAVTYTIKTSFYPSIVENLYEYYAQKADSYEKENGVQLVSCNRTGNIFTVTVDKANYKANSHYDMLEDLYYNAAIYQSYLGVEEDNVSVNFQMKYLHEQFTFTDYQFPDCLGKDLNSIAVEKETTTTASATQPTE